MSDCVRILSATIQKVKNYKLSEYNKMQIATNEIAGNFEWSTSFSIKTEVMARKKKCQFDYEKEKADEFLTEENELKKLSQLRVF